MSRSSARHPAKEGRSLITLSGVIAGSGGDRIEVEGALVFSHNESVTLRATIQPIIPLTISDRAN